MKKLVLALFVGLAIKQASASAFLTMLAIKFAVEFGTPLTLMACYGLSHTPSIHIFGTEEATYGLDWGSLCAHSKNIYGMQLSLVGGGFSEDLYGLQCGILTSGRVSDGYDISRGCMNGIQYATFAAEAATVNGIQLSPVLAWADSVNGIQCGIVNRSDRVSGIQVGIYNSTVSGHCLQIGLANFVASNRTCPFFPIVNGCFR